MTVAEEAEEAAQKVKEATQAAQLQDVHIADAKKEVGQRRGIAATVLLAKSSLGAAAGVTMRRACMQLFGLSPRHASSR